MEGLQGRTAVITGGEVGSHVAESLLKAGGNVAFIYRNQNRLKYLEGRFSGYGNSFLPVSADLSKAASAKKAADYVSSTFGCIDFLVNGLGGWLGGKRLHEHSDVEFLEMFGMDVIPTFNIMSAILPIMVERRFGKIINFISMQVFGTGAGNSVYAASKSAVFALTKSAAQEYGSLGISAYAIAPSTIDTEANRKAMPNVAADGWVKLDEIVDAVLFLCGTGSSSSGTVIKFNIK